MSAVEWVHCVICKTLARELNGVPLLITSCGKLVCQSCCSRVRNTSCSTCVGGCRTVELNGKAPSKVQNLFKHVSSQMKSNLKTLNWQDAQKKSILEHREKEVVRLEANERVQQEEEAKLDQQLEQKRQELRKMEELEVQLKANIKSVTTRESGSGGGGSKDNHQLVHQSSNHSLLHQGQHHGGQWMGKNLPGGPSPGLLSSAFYKGMNRQSPANSLLGLDAIKRFGRSGGSGERVHPTNKPSNSGFFQMPTPAAWSKKPA